MGETREFPLEDWTVEHIGFDFQTRLLLYPPEAGSAPDCTVTLEGTFVIVRPGQDDLSVDPGPPFKNADAVLELHRAAVTRFAASEDGTLRIDFDGGRAIQAERDQHYESWNVHGPIELLCSPHDAPPWGA